MIWTFLIIIFPLVKVGEVCETLSYLTLTLQLSFFVFFFFFFYSVVFLQLLKLSEQKKTPWSTSAFVWLCCFKGLVWIFRNNKHTNYDPNKAAKPSTNSHFTKPTVLMMMLLFNPLRKAFLMLVFTVLIWHFSVCFSLKHKTLRLWVKHIRSWINFGESWTPEDASGGLFHPVSLC